MVAVFFLPGVRGLIKYACTECSGGDGGGTLPSPRRGFDPAYLHHSMFYGLYSTEYKPFYFPQKYISG